MEPVILFFQNYGVVGLFVVSFIESFISPILPDLLLIPMALSAPEQAIYYSVIATTASVLGGIIGYFIGNRLGLPVLQKYAPAKHIDTIHNWLEKYGGWAIFFAAMAPIPYKFVSISAGVFRVNMVVFLLASAIGRGKRFLLEGILIFYYGPQAVELIKRYSNNFIIGFIAVAVIVGIVIVAMKMRKKPVKGVS
ncbi:YqaA family protein [Pelosinus sp. sgz500959]|uniref:YqaA family protein n=1 Tax=Pelosinus sp. sgz500959 TaxID=3242472 RepID=UPI00366EAA18